MQIKLKTQMYLKVLYYLSFLTYATTDKYLTLYYRFNLLLPSDQIGIITSINPLLAFISSYFWSAIVQKYENYVLLVIGTSTVSCGIFWALIGVQGFWGVLCVCAFWAFFGNASGVLIDNYTLKVLEEKEMYGRQRLWGSISYG